MTSEHEPNEHAARYSQLLFEVGAARAELKKAAATTNEAYTLWLRAREDDKDVTYKYFMSAGDCETYWRLELQRREGLLRDMLGEWPAESDDE